MRHSYYGDLQGSFEGRGWEFFKRGWWLWLLAPIALLSCFRLAPFVYGAFKAVEWRWWLSGIRFGDVRLELTMRRSALIGLYWKVIGWIVVLALVIRRLSGGVRGAGRQHERYAVRRVFQDAGVLPRAFRCWCWRASAIWCSRSAINVVMRVYLVRDLWVRVLASTIVHGIEAAANVSARGELANALGEGFADGLDVAGF